MYADMEEILKNLDPHIGTMYVSSDERSIFDKVMEETFWGTWESDWRFIQINAKKTLKETTPPIPAVERPTRTTTYNFISPLKHIHVTKYGKASGETIGTVSAALTVLRKRNESTPPLPKNPEKFPSVALYQQPV